jgi:hypothetical protein
MFKYQDSWFGHDPLFHYYMFNWIIKKQALNTTCFLYSQLNKNNLFLDEFSNFINSNRGDQFLNKIVWYV